MRKKSLLLVFVLVIGFALTAVSFEGNPNGEGYAEASVTTVQASETAVTMRDIASFLEEKSAHYPLSDEFIERYQQASGGYIDLAKKTAGVIVDKEKHEPNQKWHFFDSWLYPSIEDGSLTWEESAQNRVYSKLLCPELLLWIYEACGVSPVKVKAAKDVAEQGRAAGTAVTTIAKNMRACVSWDDLANGINNYTPAEKVTLNPTKLTLTVGESATISATAVSGEAASYSWSVVQGENLISITQNGNQATVNALAKGTAKVQVSYGDKLTAECTVTVKDAPDPSSQTSVKYNLSGTSTAQIKTLENALTAFKLDGESEGIIESIGEINFIYGGGSGGSGDNRWSSTDMIKLGTGSNTGSITINLNVEVSRIIITGYVHDTKCEIRVGDSSSTDWTDEDNDNKTATHSCSDMNVIGKDVIESGDVSTIVIDFESTSSITIATINTTSAKYPLYITSIEFVLSSEAEQ